MSRRTPYAVAFLGILSFGALGALAPPPFGALAPPPLGAQPRPAGSASPELQRQARSHFREGKKRYALRQFRKALYHFRRAYELVPLSGFLFNIGQCHRFLGDCKQAIFYYSGFIRENPDTPDAKFVNGLINRCQIRMRTTERRRDQAKKLYDEARKSYMLAQYTSALKQFTDAYRTMPLPGYLFHIAESHRGLKQWGKAIHFYRSYLRENPGTPKAKQVYAQLAQCRQRLQEEQAKTSQARRIASNLGLGKGQKPALPPPPKPWYKRWWVWTTVAVTVAAAVGLGVGLGYEAPQSMPNSDHVLDLRSQ